MKKQRCNWCGDDPLCLAYHDQEWGVPVYDDQTLFEFLILEGMQAGLSWTTILRKREHMRRVFSGFDPQKIVRYRQAKIDRLLQDPGIIRSPRKIAALINNAAVYLDLAEQGRSLSDFLWQFTEGVTVQNAWKNEQQIPTSTPASKAMAKALKKAGFKFVGETICYALMQAVGMVNDHVVDCYRYRQL